jgi:hypothetical protein
MRQRPRPAAMSWQIIVSRNLDFPSTRLANRICVEGAIRLPCAEHLSDSTQCCPPAMHGFGVGQRSPRLQPLRSSAQRGTVRDGKINTGQANNGADHPSGLPRSQAKHLLQRQRRRCRDRFFSEPGCQATPLASGSIVLRPVRCPAPIPRDVVPTIGAGFEQRGSHRMSGKWKTATYHQT